MAMTTAVTKLTNFVNFVNPNPNPKPKPETLTCEITNIHTNDKLWEVVLNVSLSVITLPFQSALVAFFSLLILPLS